VITEFHIGIDDTDSKLGGCTTYTAALIFQELVSRGLVPLDFPWLVRLNPNVPWKTRGNGALSLHFIVEENQLEEGKSVVVSTVEHTAELEQRSTDPAIVFLNGPIGDPMTEFSERALHDILSVKEARSVAQTTGSEVHLLKGARGLVGAIAAIGAQLDRKDHTFEIIAYRTQKRLGTVREVDADSVRSMNSKYQDTTFHNLDPESGRILIFPHGPDPVLFGIRGYDPQTILLASQEIRANEPIDAVMIFRTNQGTDAHLNCSRRIADLEPHQSTRVDGRLETMPRVLHGGHTIFRLSDNTGRVDCVAYRASGTMTRIVRELVPGDRIRAYGGVRGWRRGILTLNLERVDVLGLGDVFREENPTCNVCGRRCESMGRGQGFRCKGCGFRPRDASRNLRRVERNLHLATYTPPPGARRHLSKPGGEMGLASRP
jgi:tRNA(Ile2)-agmatinylcytidine synthase